MEFPTITFNTNEQPKRPEGLRAPVFGSDDHNISAPGSDATDEKYASIHRKTTDEKQNSPTIDYLRNDIVPRNWEKAPGMEFGRPLLEHEMFQAYQPWDMGKWPDTAKELFQKTATSGIEISGEIERPPTLGLEIKEVFEKSYDKSLQVDEAKKKSVDDCKVFINKENFDKMKRYMQTEIDTIASAYIANIYSKLERMADRTKREADHKVKMEQLANKKRLEDKLLEVKKRKLSKATAASVKLKQEMDNQYNELKQQIQGTIADMLKSTANVIQEYKLEDANNDISPNMSQALVTPSRLLSEITKATQPLDGTVATIRGNFEKEINAINKEFNADHSALDNDLKNLDDNEDAGADASGEVYDKEKAEALALTKTFLRGRIAKHGFVFPSDPAKRVQIHYRKTSASGEGGELAVQQRNIKGYLVAIAWSAGTRGVQDKTTIVLDDPKYPNQAKRQITMTISDTCFAESPPETANVSVEDTGGESAPPADTGGEEAPQEGGFVNNRYFDSVSSDHF